MYLSKLLYYNSRILGINYRIPKIRELLKDSNQLSVEK